MSRSWSVTWVALRITLSRRSAATLRAIHAAAGDIGELLRVEEHRQRGWRPEHLSADVRVVAVGIEPQVGQAVEQEVDRRAHLQPRQVHAQADVYPVAPPQIRLGLPV